MDPAKPEDPVGLFTGTSIHKNSPEAGAPGAAQTTKMADFRPLTNSKFPPKVQPRIRKNGIRKNPGPGYTRAGVDLPRLAGGMINAVGRGTRV